MNYYKQPHVTLYMNKEKINKVIEIINTKYDTVIVDPKKIKDHIVPHFRNFNTKSNEMVYDILEKHMDEFIFLNLRNSGSLNIFTPENLFLDLKQVQIISGLDRLRNQGYENKIIIDFTTTINKNGKINNTDILRDTILKSYLTRSFYNKKDGDVWINNNVSRNTSLLYSTAVSSLLFRNLNLDFTKSKIIKLVFFHYYYSLITGKKDLNLNRTIVNEIKIDPYIYSDILDYLKDFIKDDMTFSQTVLSLNKMEMLQLQKSISPNEIISSSSNWADKNSILSYSVHSYPPNFLYLLYKFQAGLRSSLFFIYKQLKMDKDINSILNDIRLRDL